MSAAKQELLRRIRALAGSALRRLGIQRSAVAGRHAAGAVRLFDHAFVSGGTFACPSNFDDALRMTGRAEDARLLLDVWDQFRANGEVAPTVRLGLGARLINEHAVRERVSIGDHTVIRGMLRQERGGRIEVGRYVYVGDNSIINAAEEVVIGDHTLIAHNVNILDNDTHPIGTAEREAHFRYLLGERNGVAFRIESAPVRIGHHCWLGLNCTILKGVEIGDETIVGAGSVVNKPLPPGCFASGVPAKPIKQL